MTKRIAGYESGMQISHDPFTHKVTVKFRGRVVELPWRCDTEEQAKHAGEAYCWQHGWRPPQKHARPAVSQLLH